MKTLIFNGSPRDNGDTAFLINELRQQLDSKVMLIDTFYSEISPCTDCRNCWKKVGCSINDDMQDVYEYIKECDNIVIASPLHFSELTGTLLSVASRLQVYYGSKRFLNVVQVTKRKKGAIILCGGGDGGPEMALSTAGTLLKLMQADLVKTVTSLHTDDLPSKDDEAALTDIADLAEMLNNE